jgi:hypothetical protein
MRNFATEMLRCPTQGGMPTVFRHGPYRAFFYSADGAEPAHIHVQREENVAKFWLEPVRLADRGQFGLVEARRIEAIVKRNVAILLRSWDEFFKR